MWHRYCFAFILITLPFTGSAQMGNFQGVSSGSQEPVISLDPNLPGPGDAFTATVEDYSGSLFGSQIIWTYNGEIIEEGNNRPSVELVAGPAGSDYTISAELRTADGEQRLITTQVSPIYIDIIIEPQTRVPEWYKGRALPSHTSQINATALLHDGTDFLDTNQIVYSWRVNRTPIDGGTVRGGYKVSFETPRGSQQILVVSASDLRGNPIASRAMLMPSVQPEIIYYEKHSLYGLSHLPIRSNASLIGNVLTLQAEPYNLDSRVYNNPDISQWEVNRNATDNGSSNPYEITLSRSGGAGQTLLNFHVRSLEQVLQGAEANVTVNF